MRVPGVGGLLANRSSTRSQAQEPQKRFGNVETMNLASTAATRCRAYVSMTTLSSLYARQGMRLASLHGNAHVPLNDLSMNYVSFLSGTCFEAMLQTTADSLLTSDKPQLVRKTKLQSNGPHLAAEHLIFRHKATNSLQQDVRPDIGSFVQTSQDLRLAVEIRKKRDLTGCIVYPFFQGCRSADRQVPDAEHWQELRQPARRY